jgi:hypothetical protein
MYVPADIQHLCTKLERAANKYSWPAIVHCTLRLAKFSVFPVPAEAAVWPICENNDATIQELTDLLGDFDLNAPVDAVAAGGSAAAAAPQ